ncbi:MAG TPA: translation initiation factor IF-3 [Oscillospiraceae bacterium]|nr:translation initiation factor IF-3 [Oscillospiraceae bacterium]
MLVNEQIRAKEVRVIDSEGNQLGVMSAREAVQKAMERNLDLVAVSLNAKPPVCRIMDVGKYKFEQSKRDKESRKNQKIITVKEVKVRPKIEEHDFQVKLKNARRFLTAGDKVKATVMFRGREISHPELGRKLLERLAEEVADLSSVERFPKVEGRNMVMILAPKSN